MKILCITPILCCFLFITPVAFPQGNLNIHFGPSFPLNDFGNSDFSEEDAGGATIGLNAGIQYYYQLNPQKLSLYGQLDFHYLDLQDDYTDAFETNYTIPYSTGTLDYNYYSYIMFPVTGGVNYLLTSSQKVKIYGNAGITANFLKMTDMTIELNNNGEIRYTYEWANNTGYNIGGQLIFNQNTSFAIQYFSCGEHHIDFSKSSPFTTDQEYDSKLTISMLTLTVGFLL